MAAHEERGSAQVVVGGQVYDRMLSLNLKRSKDEACCSGSIVLSWPGAEQFNMTQMVLPVLMDGAEGMIMLDGQLAAKIVFDVRLSKGSPKQYEMTLQFRGAASCLVDSSPQHKTGQENRQDAVQVMKKLMEGFPVQLIDNSGGGGKQIERFIIAEGETVERAARRVAREQSLRFFENKEGNWVLEKNGQSSGTGGGGSLVLGKNFTQWSTKRDLSPRFGGLVAYGSMIPTDKNYGKIAESIISEATQDLAGGGAGGKNKHMRAFMDGDHNTSSMQDRGQMEGDARSQQGLNVTLKMSTWTNNSGQLWDVGQMYAVSIPVDAINESLEVREVEFELTPDSRSATVVLTAEGGGTGSAGNFFDAQNRVQPSDQQPQQIQPPGPEQTLTQEQIRQNQEQWRQMMRDRAANRQIPGPQETK